MPVHTAKRTIKGKVSRARQSIRSRAPSASSPLVRRVMQRNTGHETEPERLLRTFLKKAGLRFRTDTRPEPHLKIKADIVFPRQRVCVFLDGCFWHGCPIHFKVPNSHSPWWKEKIQDNARRDARQTQALRRLKWKVIRYWEHQIQPEALQRINARIGETLDDR